MEPVNQQSGIVGRMLGDLLHKRPVIQAMNLFELSSLGGDLDHVVELVVVTFSGALHEPGVDLGTELDFAHGEKCVGD